MKRAYIEITNACNLRCSFCPSPELSGQRTWMKLPLFEKTLDQLNGLVKEVYFHVLGEPLLHPLLNDFLKACASREMRVNLTTNGVLIKDRASTLQASTALRQINFSLHALQEIPDPQQAADALNAIIAFTRTTAERRPDIFINLRLWNNGAQSVQEKNWNARIHQRLCKEFNCHVDPAAFDAGKKIELGGRMCIHQEKQFEWPADVARSTVRDRGTCQALKTHCAILVDGRIVACCLDYRGDLTLGYVEKDGIQAALSSDRAQAIRTGFNQNRLVEPFCQQCTFCTRFSR